LGVLEETLAVECVRARQRLSRGVLHSKTRSRSRSAQAFAEQDTVRIDVMCIIVWVFAETGRRSLWGLDLDIVDVERAVDIGPVLDDDSDVVDLRRSTVESPFDMVPLVRSDAEDERTDPT